jgi:hypothetical protein
MMTTQAGKIGRICSAFLIEAWEDRGCLMLRIAIREGGGEQVVRCNAAEPELLALTAAADRCLDALRCDDRELGAGD